MIGYGHGAGVHSSVEGSDVGYASPAPPGSAWRPFLQRSRRKVNLHHLLFLSLEAIRASVERQDVECAVEQIEILQDAIGKAAAPEDPQYREQVSQLSLRQARNRRYYEARLSKTAASESKTPKTSENVLQASESSSSLSLRSYSNSQDIEEKRESVSDGKTSYTSESKTRVRRGERPPPTDAPQEEIDAWCLERGLPVGHPSLERFLDEQRTAKLAKTDWKATWRRNEPRITLQLAEETAKRARLNGVRPASGMTLARANEERPAPYHQIWKPSRDGQ